MTRVDRQNSRTAGRTGSARYCLPGRACKFQRTSRGRDVSSHTRNRGGLQPILTPYHIAFYWHLFRHSIARDGNLYLRISTRDLQTGVVKSKRGDTIALQNVREILAALESVGAIRKEGEPNREGTPYRVLIPDEIEACRKLRAERMPAEPRAELAKSEVDYYNVCENRIKVYERDGCAGRSFRRSESGRENRSAPFRMTG